ncbi:MAG: hypothetical protein AB2793_08225, partial [Candidatus Thiodiazotropha sp.]
MDAMTLRIVLLVLGCVFLAGIYLYETNRRKRDSAQARKRRVERVNSAHEVAPAEMVVEQVEHPDEQATIVSPEGDDTWIDWDEEDTELLNQKVD